MRLLLFATLVIFLLPIEPLRAQNCEGTLTATGILPLNDLGPLEYRAGHVGGLYPAGSNIRPAEHLGAGVAMATTLVVPRDPTGVVDPESGLIGMISVGMSNTTQQFSRFRRRAVSDRARNPRLVLVDGAQGGQAAEDWVSSDRPWNVLRDRIRSAGLTAEQVQVAWMKHANRTPGRLGEFDIHALELKSDLSRIVRRLKSEFPNLRLMYLSSRTRAYTDDPRGLNPEPFAYESGFSVRWTIEDQLEGVDAMSYELDEAPWLSWGPYLWVDGENPRSDGLVWLARDLNRDCTHPSESGREKVADQLGAFFKADVTTTPWYLRATMAGDAPLVEVETSSASGPAPLTVDFTADARPSAANATVTQFAWSFDDGGTSLERNPAKVFLVPGHYQVRLTVSDSLGNTNTLTIPIEATEGAPALPSIVRPASPLEPGLVGAPYSVSFSATGSPPITWRIAEGSPPPGLELSPNGRYTGTPSRAGVYSFTVEAANARGIDTAAYEHTIDAPPPVVVLEAVADAYVRDGRSAERNFGGDARLAVRASASAGQNARSYVKFDLDGLEGPVEAAVLRLHASGGNPDRGPVTVLSVADDAWSENGINWSTMPPLGIELATVDIDRSGVPYDFEVTSFVNSEIAGDRIVSFCIRDETEGGPVIFFDSRETDQSPVLEVRLEDDSPRPFRRSDCTGDGATNISDPVLLLQVLFAAAEPVPCEDACDSNDDGDLDIGDAIATLNMLFSGGPLPGAPFPDCGEDAGEDDLGCESFPACRGEDSRDDYRWFLYTAGSSLLLEFALLGGPVFLARSRATRPSFTPLVRRRRATDLMA